jgi:hypothetical protein
VDAVEAVHKLCVLQSFEEGLQGMLFVRDGYFTNGTLRPLMPRLQKPMQSPAGDLCSGRALSGRAT